MIYERKLTHIVESRQDLNTLWFYFFMFHPSNGEARVIVDTYTYIHTYTHARAHKSATEKEISFDLWDRTCFYFATLGHLFFPMFWHFSIKELMENAGRDGAAPEGPRKGYNSIGMMGTRGLRVIVKWRPIGTVMSNSILFPPFDRPLSSGTAMCYMEEPRLSARTARIATVAISGVPHCRQFISSRRTTSGKL